MLCTLHLVQLVVNANTTTVQLATDVLDSSLVMTLSEENLLKPPTSRKDGTSRENRITTPNINGEGARPSRR